MANYFSKVYLYANSRLPPHLPILKLYVHIACLGGVHVRCTPDSFFVKQIPPDIPTAVSCGAILSSCV